MYRPFEGPGSQMHFVTHRHCWDKRQCRPRIPEKAHYERLKFHDGDPFLLLHKGRLPRRSRTRCKFPPRQKQSEDLEEVCPSKAMPEFCLLWLKLEKRCLKYLLGSDHNPQGRSLWSSSPPGRV